MRSICMLLLSGLCLLAGAQPGAAKTCDEVLYVALDETTLEPFRGGTRYLEPFTVPHYVGAVCLDNVNKKLEYFSRTRDGFLNLWMRGLVLGINDDKNPNILLSANLEYLELGEGNPAGEYFSAPKNTALFPYWIEEAIKYKKFKVIRREVNAGPDLEWTPTIERTFYYADLEPGPQPEVYDWSEKTCDEVLYLALNGVDDWLWTGPFSRNSEVFRLPHYLGAVCVDNVNKKLAFVPRSKEASFTEDVDWVVGSINSKRTPIMMVRSTPDNRKLGEGTVWGDYLAVSKDTARLSYWTAELLRKYRIEVFRREENARLDPEWTPQFTQTRPFCVLHMAPDLSYR